MQQIIDFFTGLFDTDKWPPRWHCGTWSDFHGWLFIISDLMIWLAYFLIPLIILQYFTGKKGHVKFSSVYLLFATFILLCGSTHFIDAMMFWIPMYRFNALVRFATGIVSLLTVYHLIKILPQAFKQKTNIELENEISRRKEVERQLSEANANLESFASIASHDLQEPLRKIRMYASTLVRDNASDNSERNKDMLAKIEAASARMQTMIKDILTLSTVRLSADFGQVNINDAITLALEDLEVKIKERKAMIDVQLMPEINGNKEYLSLVFMNLISNAIKFSKDAPHISITHEIRNERIIIYVADNGIGIETDKADKIFMAFQRLHSRNEYEGAGLGLAICKRIIELHKGKISVESKPGKGTTFIIELPIK